MKTVTITENVGAQFESLVERKESTGELGNKPGTYFRRKPEGRLTLDSLTPEQETEIEDAEELVVYGRKYKIYKINFLNAGTLSAFVGFGKYSDWKLLAG